MLADRIHAALRRAYEEAGTQQQLQKKTGVSQGQITNLLSGRRSCGGLRVDTLEKLFPDLVLTFFRDERKVDSAQSQDLFLRHIANYMASMDDDRKARCLALIAEEAGKASVHVEESPPRKSKLAG